MIQIGVQKRADNDPYVYKTENNECKRGYRCILYVLNAFLAFLPDKYLPAADHKHATPAC